MLRRKVSTGLSLPTRPNEPPEEFHQQCAMYFGRKSWGKTTLVSQYPNAIVMLLEPARRNLRILQVPKKDETADWELINNYIDLFLESEHEILAIDTIDRYYEHCLKAVCMMEAGVEHPAKASQDDRPALWDLAKNEFEHSLERIKDSGKSWVITSHDKKAVNRHPITGVETEQIVPSCKPAAWKIAQSMCDYVFHVDLYNRQRCLTIRDMDNISIASCGRSDVFLDPDGKLLARVALPQDATKAYATVLDAYNNKLYDVDYEPPRKPLKPKSPPNGAGTQKRRLLVRR